MWSPLHLLSTLIGLMLNVVSVNAQVIGERYSSDAPRHPLVKETLRALKSYVQHGNVQRRKLQSRLIGHLASCFTTLQRRRIKGLDALCKGLVQERVQQAKINVSNDKAYRRFNASQFRIDFDWKTRHGLSGRMSMAADKQARVWMAAQRKSCTGQWFSKIFRYSQQERQPLFGDT